MKVFAVLFLFILVSKSHSVIINCQFSMDKWDVAGEDAYSCNFRAENTGSSTVIEEVRGEHLDGKNNANVQVIYVISSNLQFIPSNLARFFPNLIIMALNDLPLLRVTAGDLKPFPNLQRFYSTSSLLTSINGDLFQHTKKLQRIRFEAGKLQDIGENLLSDLNDLSFVSFQGNECIDFVAETPQEIEELKEKLLVQCPPLENESTTIISMTTVTDDQCSFRCSLYAEVDELRLKVDEQNERLVELEKVVREINARP